MGVISEIHGRFDIECDDEEVDYDQLIVESDQESWEAEMDSLIHATVEKDHDLIENLQKVLVVFAQHNAKISGFVYVIYPEYPGEVEMIKVEDCIIKKYKATWVKAA